MASHPVRNTGGSAGLLVHMENMKHFDGPTFEADVLNASEPVVVDFYADWCGPCRMMTPVVEQLAGEYAGKVTIGKLDVDVNQDIAIKYGVMGIPTLGLSRSGQRVAPRRCQPPTAAPLQARTTPQPP